MEKRRQKFWTERHALAEQRKNKRKELEQRGWKSTGDLPYIFGPELERGHTLIASRVRSFLTKSLEGKDEEYIKNHVVELDGIRTMVSPELVADIRRQVQQVYKERLEKKRGPAKR